MHYLSFLFICAVWGSSFILMKKGTVCFSPASIGAWRVIGGAAILVFGFWRQSGRMSLRLKDAGPILFAVIFGFVWPFSIQPYLVLRHGSAFVGMTVSLTPLLTILASVPILGLLPTPRQVVGVTGALVFLALLMVDGLKQEIPAINLACAVSVPLSYALTNTVVRRTLQHVPPLELTLACLVASGSMLVPLSYLVPFERSTETSTADMQIAVGSLLFLGIIGTGISTFLFNGLIQTQGPLFAGMVTNVVPIGAVVWGWVDRERVTSLQMIALAGILSMVLLVQIGAKRPGDYSPRGNE